MGALIMEDPKIELQILREGLLLARYILEPGHYILGRGGDCQVQVPATLVSRQHAKLTIVDQNFYIEDLGSANGTFLDERPVTGSTRFTLNQRVALGDATLIFAPDTGALALPEGWAGDPKYEIGKMVARGGMGAILSAWERATERHVAMKVMLDHAPAEQVERFITEARITGQLEHPNIVPVHELGVDEEDQLFYTMKFVRGITLKKVLDLIAAGTPGTIQKYPLANLLTVFQKVCDALAFAHSRGVIHRDLKPENLMIGDFGEVLVMDWGLAKVLSRSESHTRSKPISHPSLNLALTLDGSIMGTPQYMAPEQARGDVEALDPRTDIYALGAILYEILTLKPPVEGESLHEILEQVIHGRIALPHRLPNPGAHLPDRMVPESLSAVAMKAMARTPSARYQSVSALQAEIEAFEHGFATTAENASPAKQLTLLVKRHRKSAIASLMIFILLGTLMTSVVFSQRAFKASLDRLRNTAPTFQAQALALLEEAATRPSALEEALRNIEHSLDLQPESADSLYLQGRILQTRRDLEGARLAFERTLKFAPNHARALENRDLCDQLLRDQNGISQLSAANLAQLQAALLKQGRAREVVALMIGSRSNPQQTADAWSALVQQAGIDRNLQLAPGGGLSLSLDNLPVDNLAFLKGMPLVELSLRQTRVSDLAPLAGIPLQRLACPGCPITDLSPLRGMPLRWLNIADTKITDLSPLRGLPLENLVLGNASNIPDFNGLNGLPLKRLEFFAYRGRDLEFLRGAPLESLRMSATQINDLSALQGLPLSELVATNCPDLRDLKPLSGLPLKSLNLNSCAKIIDISALKGLPLESVDLSGTLVTDLRPLINCPITQLSLIRSAISDLKLLKDFRRLEQLSLQKTSIEDLSPLSGLPLQNLDLRDCQRLKNFAPLQQISALRTVALPSQAYRLEALQALPNLLWLGYGEPPPNPEAPLWKKALREFWASNTLEIQIRASDSRLVPSKFPQMAQRFPGAKEFNGHWYAVYRRSLPWREARACAEAMGGHLATITTAEENAFLGKQFTTTLAFQTGLWLGAHLDGPGAKWEWITDEPWQFTHWGRRANGFHEPNEGNRAFDTRLAYWNAGDLINTPAWNDQPENAGLIEGLLVEWEN